MSKRSIRILSWVLGVGCFFVLITGAIVFHRKNERIIIAQRTTCLTNLRALKKAQQSWAEEQDKMKGDTVSFSDLLFKMGGNTTPCCPANGVYTVTTVDVPPSCSIHGRVD